MDFGWQSWKRYRDYHFRDIDVRDENTGSTYSVKVIEAIVGEGELPGEYNPAHENRNYIQESNDSRKVTAFQGMITDFANIQTEDDILAFAKQWGMLGIGLKAAAVGDTADPQAAEIRDTYFQLQNVYYPFRSKDKVMAATQKRMSKDEGIAFPFQEIPESKMNPSEIRLFPHRVEPVEYWWNEIERMRDILDTLQNPSQMEGPFASLHLHRVNPELIMKRNGQWAWGWSYQSLIDAMYFLAGSLTVSKEFYIRSCQHCGKWFLSKKKNTKYHTENCRINYNQKKLRAKNK